MVDLNGIFIEAIKSYEEAPYVYLGIRRDL
jgi:hypothetical protein